MSDAPMNHPNLASRLLVVRMMARGWWVFVLRGVIAILFGVLAFLLPGLGLAVIIGILAAWMLLDGIGTLYQAVKGPPERHGFWFWLDGIASILAAAALLILPAASAIVLVLIAGFWSIVIGVFRLVLAFRLGSVLMGLLGALTIFIGAWLIAKPGPGLLALIWVVGLEAIIMGALMIGLGWRLRRLHNEAHGLG